MPLDPRIAMGFQSPQFESPVNMMGDMMKLKSMQQQNALAEQQMGDLAAEQARTALLNKVYGESVGPEGTLDYGKLRRGLAQGGQGALLPGVIKQEYEEGEAKSKRGKADLELFGQALEARRTLLNPNMTPEAYMAWHEGNHKDPIVGPKLTLMGINPADSRAQIMARIQRGELPQLIAESAMGVQKLYDAVRPVETAAGIEMMTPTGTTLAMRKAPPKSAGVTIDMTGRGNIEATKEVVGSLVRTRESLAQAPTLWQNLEDAKPLIKEAKGFMGAGGELALDAASFLNNRFGTNIDTQGVKTATELRSRMFQGIVSTLKQLDSNPSQSQQAALQQALGGIGTDPSALENVINVAQDIISGRVERYNRDATKASQKLDFPIDMPIEMPTRKAPTATGAPPPPPGFKIR